MLVQRTALLADPNARSPLDLSPATRDAPDFMSTVGAAFRQENVIGSLMSHQWSGGGRQAGYSPWDEVKGTPYESEWDSFTKAYNPGQTAAVKRQIDMERADRETLAAAGGWGMLAQIGAGIFSPENLLPGGVVYRGVKTGSAVLRTALSTASAAAMSTALAETALQGTQELRTLEESAISVGTSALLGGALGAGISAVFSKADFARLAKSIEQEADAALAVDLQAREAGLFNSTSLSSVGAAARDIPSLDDNSIAGAAAGLVGKATSELNPALRALHSSSAVYRDIATRLIDVPVYLKRNMAGQTAGPGVETLVKQFTQGAMAKALDDANGIYSEFRKAGGQMDRAGFNQAVGRAMRRGDQDADPAVARAAQVWRSTIFDPLKQRAIDAGLLPPDVSVDTALSYFTRVYNRPLIEAREPEFKGIVRRHIEQALRHLELKRDEITVGNTVVKADQISERFARANERLTNMEARLTERGGVRRRMVSALNDLERKKYLAEQGRPPAELVRLIRGADENAGMIDTIREARAAERAAGAKKPFSQRSPILSLVKRKGGVRIGTTLDQELRAMGVTPRTHPSLFKKDAGLGALDNLPHGEEPIIFENLTAGSDGYVPEQELLDAIRAEVRGEPLMTQDQRLIEAEAENLTSWAEHYLTQVGLGSNANVGAARQLIRAVTGAEREADGLVARTNSLIADLDRFDEVTEGIENEKIISREEMRAVETEMQALNEEIIEAQQYVNAAPGVGLIVDYAKTRRDLFKARMKERDLTTRVDALKSLRDSNRANDAMLADLYTKTEELTRVTGDVQRLVAKADKLQPMVPKMRRELPDFVNDADRAAYVDEIVGDIFNQITGRNVDGDLPRDIVAAARGPLKERTLHIPDEEIEQFLEDDVEAVARRYARTMAADVELTQQFGKADLKEQIDQVKRDYAAQREAIAAGIDPKTGAPFPTVLAQAGKERLIRNLVRREKSDIRDLQAMRDMVRGAYLARENSTNLARTTRVAGQVNFIRTLGGVTLSSLSDVGRHVMTQGFGNVMRDGLLPLIRQSKGLKLSVEEARVAGAVTERLLNTRLATWAELTDPYSNRSPFEAFMENTSRGFAKLTLLDHWTDMQKSFSSVMVQTRILRSAGFYARVKPSERAYLAFLGIDAHMAERIAKQFTTHGETDEAGVKVANTEDWDDEIARRTYRAAVLKDVESTVVTKGVADIPLWMNTPLGRLMGQFKSFALASHQRVLMRGLQERPAGFVAGSAMMVSMGMLIYFLKSIEANRQEDISDNPGRWLAEGIDRSGILSVAFEINNTIEKATGLGAYGALAAIFPGSGQGGKASRYVNRGVAAMALGPTGDLIDGIAASINAMKADGKWTEGEINTLKRMIPGATLPGIRSLVEYLGVPAVEQALVKK